MAATSLTKRRKDARRGGKKKARTKARDPDKSSGNRKDKSKKRDARRDDVTTRRAISAPLPGVQYITSLDDIPGISFVDGLAAVEAPVEVVRRIPFKNDHRERSPRLIRIERSIRDRGYDNTLPIIARIGQKGRWIIVDGGHRLTAAKTVSEEFWSNLLSKKVRTLYFLLFTTARSWAKVKRIAKAKMPHAPPPKTTLPKHPAEIDADEIRRFRDVTRREKSSA